MSRSFRNNQILRDVKRGLYFKRYASSKVRNYKSVISNGNFYKRLYDRWYIYDWIYKYTVEESIDTHIKDGNPPEVGYDYWARKFYSK